MLYAQLGAFCHRAGRKPARSSGGRMTSQPARVKRGFAFGGRFAQESFQFRMRVRIINQLLPTLIIHLRELTQLLEYGASLCVTKFWQFLDDLRCAHGTSLTDGSQFGKVRKPEVFGYQLEDHGAITDLAAEADA